MADSPGEYEQAMYNYELRQWAAERPDDLPYDYKVDEETRIAHDRAMRDWANDCPSPPNREYNDAYPYSSYD